MAEERRGALEAGGGIASPAVGEAVEAAEVADDDAFDPRWLAVALPAILRRAQPARPAEIGIEVRDVLLAVRVDGDDVHVIVEPEDRPATVVAVEPDVVLGLAAGALGVDHPGITVHGDPRQLAAVLGGAA